MMEATGFKTSDYYYDLPKEYIAQDPLTDRSSSKLLLLDRNSGEIRHKSFCDIADLIEPGDCLVLNDTKVIPARLLGTKADTGASVEVFLLKRLDEHRWETLVRPGKKLKKGAEVLFGDGLLKAHIEDILGDGNRIVRFDYEGIFEELLDALGEMPLPPYITHKLEDRNRYQTVYARYDGSAAAPTAGLHFTEELLGKLEVKGTKLCYVTLHVGLGTFRPVKCENITEHHMHTESYSVSPEAAEKINTAKASGKRVICVGTTSCRTIESAASDEGIVRPGAGETGIFIYPGYRFKVMDGLITNFHLPESTLLMLVSAFATREKVLAAYEEAKREGYRFFSFGDAMAVLDRIR